MSHPPIEGQLAETAAFEACSERFGWQYDNGGLYQGERWDWYRSSLFQFSGESGHIVLVRQSSGIVALIHFQELPCRVEPWRGKVSTPTEVWRGTIAENIDLDRAMNTLAEYLVAHRLEVDSPAPKSSRGLTQEHRSG